MKKVTLLAAMVAASLMPLRAANIVLNPGFETGDFTNWTVVLAADNATDLDTRGTPNTGDFAAEFGSTTVGEFDTISQTLATIAGQSYTFSFFLGADFGGGLETPAVRRNDDTSLDPVADFQAFFNGGTALLDLPAGDQGSLDYRQFSFTVMGTGNDTISFRGYNIPSFYSLDDVSVDTVAPEPSTWGLIAAGLVMFAGARARRRTTR